MGKWINRPDPRRSDAQKRAAETNIFSTLHPNYAKMLSSPQRKEWFTRLAAATDNTEIRLQISEAIGQNVLENRKFLEKEMGVAVPESKDEVTVTWVKIPIISDIVGRELRVPVVYLEPTLASRTQTSVIDGVHWSAGGIKYAIVAHNNKEEQVTTHEAIHVIDPSYDVDQQAPRKEQVVIEVTALLGEANVYNVSELDLAYGLSAAIAADLGILNAQGQVIRGYSAEDLGNLGHWLQMFFDAVPKTAHGIRALMNVKTGDDMKRFWEANCEEWGRDQLVVFDPEPYPHPTPDFIITKRYR